MSILAKFDKSMASKAKHAVGISAEFRYWLDG